MNKDAIKNLVLILLLGVAAFSMVRYVSELKARFRLQNSLIQAQSEIIGLAQEKQNLLQELGKERGLKEELAAKNLYLKSNLRASKDRMSRLFRDNWQAQNALEETSAKFTVLKAENKVLIESRKRSYAENDQLKFKLGSVAELKKAIRALRSKRPEASGREAAGNRGFLIKNGRSTTEKIKIEVVPDSHKSVLSTSGQEATK